VDTLKHAHNPCSVLPIGPAGENLVNISLCCIDKFSTLGRGGLAAVMGSKNLKAIVVCRDSYRIKAASPQDLSALVNGLQERMIKWSGRDLVLRYGVGYEAVKETVEGPNIYNNWTCASTPSEEEVGKKYPFLQMYENNWKTLSCPSCLLADKEVVQAEPGGPVFYEDHLAAVDVDKDCFHRAVEYSAYLNRLGLDRFDFASLVSLVAVLYREGLINLKDTEGIEPGEKDYFTHFKLAEMTAYRRGLGSILADGLVKAASKLGKRAEELAFHIKGHGIVFDPRLKSLGTMEFAEITSPRGAHVATGG